VAGRKKIHVQTAVVLVLMARDDRPYYAYELYRRLPWIDQVTFSHMVDRLLRDGYVTLADGPQPEHRNAAKRRYFQLTDAGRAHANTVAYERLQTLANTLAQLNVVAPEP
jgi:DNA-binding PadR family transcriptional regulator